MKKSHEGYAEESYKWTNAEKAETRSSTGLSKGISLGCVLCSVFTIKHKPQALLFIQMFCFIVQMMGRSF